ncbi:hypothetical protein GGS20DRAFT_561776 [Poronia punctata]|nr:hypothetical protein GGS20DRAFT_561776 [Poronia punctata]
MALLLIGPAIVRGSGSGPIGARHQTGTMQSWRWRYCAELTTTMATIWRLSSMSCSTCALVNHGAMGLLARRSHLWISFFGDKKSAVSRVSCIS